MSSDELIVKIRWDKVANEVVILSANDASKKEEGSMAPLGVVLHNTAHLDERKMDSRSTT